jgi:hypothetical protein
MVNPQYLITVYIRCIGQMDRSNVRIFRLLSGMTRCSVLKNCMTKNITTLKRVRLNQDKMSGAIASQSMPSVQSVQSFELNSPELNSPELNSIDALDALMSTHSLAQLLPNFYTDSTVREDGVRIYYLDNGSRWYITQQALDDGTVVYYGRLNGDRAKILRYNSSMPSTGYMTVQDCATTGSQRGYLYGQMNLISQNCQLLDELEQVTVQTADMDYGLYLLLR